MESDKSSKLKKKLHSEVRQFSFFLENEEELNILNTVFQIQVQGLEEDGFFPNSDSSDSDDHGYDNNQKAIAIPITNRNDPAASAPAVSGVSGDSKGY